VFTGERPRGFGLVLPFNPILLVFQCQGLGYGSDGKENEMEYGGVGGDWGEKWLLRGIAEYE
jgi:hypothetical protein